MSAGKRDKLVTIQRYVSNVREDSGFPSEPWENIGQEWMHRVEVPKQSMEERNHLGAGLQAAFETEWILPYRADMDPESIDVPKRRRLLYGGRTFDITRAVMRDRVERSKIVLETIASTGT